MLWTRHAFLPLHDKRRLQLAILDAVSVYTSHQTCKTYSTSFDMLRLHVFVGVAEFVVLHRAKSGAFSGSLVIAEFPCSDFGLEQLVDFLERTTLI